jgi:hypothetical protein
MNRQAFVQHAHRLKRAAIVIASLGAVYAIWTSLGFPAFPIALGDAPSGSEAPFVVQVDIPTGALVQAGTPPAKHLRRTRRVRISQHAVSHSARPAARRPTPVIVTPVREHRVASDDVKQRAKTEQTQATADAPAVVATAPASPVVPPPPPPVETQPITVTLPPAPQLPPPPLPQIPELPVAPALPAVPALPPLPLPPLP